MVTEVNTPVAIMYAPTCAISGIIYVGGGIGFPRWDGSGHDQLVQFQSCYQHHWQHSSHTAGHRRDASA